MSIPFIGSKVKHLRQKFSQSVSLPIRDALPASSIEAALEAEGVTYRECLFDPVITIWAFLSQVLDADRSCRKALSRVWAYLADCQELREKLLSDPDKSDDTGAYCKARQRLSQAVLKHLYRQVADHLEEGVEPSGLWCGRRVHLVDGTTALLPDTPENQTVYPQHPNQKKGCGFPLVKIVAIFSLLTGSLKKAVCGVWSAYEPALLRQIRHCLCPGDVLVGDRIYCTYTDIALLQQDLVDSVFRLHQARKVDFRRGKRLSKHDRIFVWEKPKRCPKEFPVEVYQQLPQTLEIRVVRFQVHQKGFRTKCVTVATTLLDPKAYSKTKIAKLYGLRWEVEIDLRHLKASMEMDMLRTKSPEMIQKELAIYFLAYNLIRSLMAEAAKRHGKDPLRLSFMGTLQHLNTFLPLLAVSVPNECKRYYDTLLVLVAREQLPDRPHRIEPRVVKRRPKCSQRMQEPRAVLKQKLAA